MRKLLLAVPLIVALAALALVTSASANNLPTVSFPTGGVTVGEDAGLLQVDVTLNPSSTVTVTVGYATQSGTALAGQDFVSATGTLTFSPGITLQTVSVVLLNDALPEQTESFSLGLANPQNAALGLYPTLAITLTDDGDKYLVFMPVVMKRWPPLPDIPVLDPISNPGGVGSYLVSWNPAYLATAYVLQEDDNAAFASPTQRYSGTATSWYASGKLPGTYYYRVKATNVWGESGWSATQGVTVTPPMAHVYLQNDTGGTLCYEVYGTGIGRKCVPGGLQFYGSFTAGTYNWHASAPCGSASDTQTYDPGENIHYFWCGQQAVSAGLSFR